MQQEMITQKMIKAEYARAIRKWQSIILPLVI